MCLKIKFDIILNFLLFIKYFTKLLFLDTYGPLKNNRFVKYLINSKKIKKNIKFHLQAHFNISIILNVWIDYLDFENFENLGCNSVSPRKGASDPSS